jgi:hypothetical protein
MFLLYEKCTFYNYVYENPLYSADLAESTAKDR